MAMVKESMELGGKTLSIETGRVAKQADGSVLVQYGDTVVLVAVVAAPIVKEGQDFFPLTVDYREKTYSAGQDPGRVFQARRQAEGQGNPHLPPDRPAAAAPVSRRLPQRSGIFGHGAVLGQGERIRHPGHDRRLGGPDHFRHSLFRAGGRGAGGQDGRPIHHQPHLQGNRGRRPGHRGGGHQGFHHDGGGQRQGDVRGRSAQGPGSGPRRDQAAVRAAGRTARQLRQAQGGSGAATSWTRPWTRRSAPW